MNDDTKAIIKWCIKKLDEMHDEVTQIKRDLDRLKRETGLEPWRDTAQFRKWYEKNIGPLNDDVI